MCTTKMTPEKGKCDNFVAYSLLGGSSSTERRSMQDIVYGLLFGVEATADQLDLRIDLTAETVDFDQQQPVICLRLLACPHAKVASEKLSANIGHPIEIVPQSQEPNRIDVFLDYEEDLPNLELEYGDSAVEHAQYTTADLTTKLKRHDMQYQRKKREDREYIKRLRGILEAVRRELRQEIDRTDRKIAFFADKGTAERYEIERQAYQKILSALEYREHQRMD